MQKIVSQGRRSRQKIIQSSQNQRNSTILLLFSFFLRPFPWKSIPPPLHSAGKKKSKAKPPESSSRRNVGTSGFFGVAERAKASQASCLFSLGLAMFSKLFSCVFPGFFQRFFLCCCHIFPLFSYKILKASVGQKQGFDSFGVSHRSTLSSFFFTGSFPTWPVPIDFAGI